MNQNGIRRRQKKTTLSAMLAAFALMLVGAPTAWGAATTSDLPDRALAEVRDALTDPADGPRTLLTMAAECTYEQACDWCADRCTTFCDGCLDRAFTCGATAGGSCACYCACKVCTESALRLVDALARS